jgi:hypothetical protein
MRLPKIGALDLRRPGLSELQYETWTPAAELAAAHRWLDAVLPSWAAGRSCAMRARLHDLEVHYAFQLARAVAAIFQPAEGGLYRTSPLGSARPHPRNVEVVCGSCAAGEHACGGGCDCDCWEAEAARREEVS